MAYSYDQHRPVLIDSARMDLDDQSDALRAMAETVPATLDDQPHERPWLGSVAAASKAPRIPRKRSPILSADSPDGTSNQGREHPESQSFPLARLDDLGHSVVLWLCAVVLAVMVPALIAGITWGDVLSLLSAIGNAV